MKRRCDILACVDQKAKGRSRSSENLGGLRCKEDRLQESVTYIPDRSKYRVTFAAIWRSVNLVDGVNPHDASAKPFTLEMVFEFDLGLTRA